MSKKIAVILGHPDADTFSGAVADAYATAAAEAGHEVEFIRLGELTFDPILHKGYKEIQPLEPDLEHIQQTVKEADHLCFVYPNWWSTMPALLKGMFDRMWLPGFAFNFDKERGRIVQHLKGKTARVIVLSGSHSPFGTWWRYGDFTNEIQYGILEFAGIKTKVSVYGPCERVSEACLGKWKQEIARLGAEVA